MVSKYAVATLGNRLPHKAEGTIAKEFCHKVTNEILPTTTMRQNIKISCTWLLKWNAMQ